MVQACIRSALFQSCFKLALFFYRIEAMIREFAEETGVETRAEEWTEFVHYICQDLYEIHFYRAFTDKIDSARTMEDEVISTFKSDGLPKNVIFNLNWLIPLSLDEKVSFASPILVRE